MLSVPVALTRLSVKFAPLFSKRVWAHAQVLLAGALLAPGKRTVTAVLRVMGLSQERHFQNYHRVLNRARWSTLATARVLLELVVQSFAPPPAWW
jgi:DDE superfamily endonuclease